MFGFPQHHSKQRILQSNVLHKFESRTGLVGNTPCSQESRQCKMVRRHDLFNLLFTAGVNTSLTASNMFLHIHTQKMLSRHEDLPPNYDHQKMERMSHEASNICLIQNILYGYGSIPINTIFSGMNIHKSQLFWCELQGYKVLMWTKGVLLVLTHCQYKHELLWGIF